MAEGVIPAGAMRTVALRDSALGCTPHGHLGWAFQTREQFHARAAEYITGALAEGQWVEYVGEGGQAHLEAEIAGLDGVPSDHVRAVPVEEFYAYTGRDGVVDPVRSVQKRVAATEAALAAGYTGFRAVVDATATSRTPVQREAFAQFEYLIDQKMAVLPVSAMCAYDVSELGAWAVAEMTCLHPLASAGSTSFHLFAEQDVDFGLAGHIDLASREVFATALARVSIPGVSGVTIDVRQLNFIDHRGLLILAGHARRSGTTIQLRTTAGSTVDHLVQILEPEGLNVEVSP